MLNGREGSSVRRRLFLVKGQLSIAADYLIWSHINVHLKIFGTLNFF